MARAQIIKNSFNTGEISPFALGRTDLEKYRNACESLQNWIPLITGGLQKRPGTRFIINAQNQAGPSRLVAFEFSTSQAFVLEFGNQTLRFFTNGGVITSAPNTPYVVATPYDTSVDNLWDLKFAQQADVMYLVHPNHPPMKLSRIADDNWLLTQPEFQSAPLTALDQDVSKSTITLTLGALSGMGVIATASAGVFIAGDVGKRIIVGAGAAYITALSGASTGNDPDTGAKLYQAVVVNVIDPFAAAGPIAAGSWLLRGPPNAYGCFGFITGGDFFAARNLGEGAQRTMLCFDDFPDENAPPKDFTDTFRLQDVGRYVVIDGCIARIDALGGPNNGAANNAQSATVWVLSPIIDTFSDINGKIRMMPASPGAWSIQDNAFSAAQGYPRAVCFCQDRLCFAGTAGEPQTIWLSVTDDFENFAIGPNDNNAVTVNVLSNTGRLETILSITPFQGILFAHCARAEYAVGGNAVQFGGNNTSAITPSNREAFPQSAHGSNGIQPIIVDEDVLYVKRLGKRAGGMAFNIQQSIYATKDLSILSELMTTLGFQEMVYQQLPNFVVWFTTKGQGAPASGGLVITQSGSPG